MYTKVQQKYNYIKQSIEESSYTTNVFADS